MSLFDAGVILPELVLSVFAMAALVWCVYSRRPGTVRATFWATSIVFFALAGWVAFSPDLDRTAFGGMFADDAFSRFAKIVILVSSGIVLILGQDFLKREQLHSFEFPLLAAFAVLGMLIMVSARDLMVMYMGIELQSLSLYVLAAYHRSSARSTEAGLKYFVLGALSSGLLLYGASLTYGFAGTTRFDGIAEAVAGGFSHGLLYGLVFMLAGLAFKVSAAPFHMWVPDVYQGAPTPVTALFATAPKVAAVLLLTRLLTEAFGHVHSDWGPIIAVLSVASMFLGAVAAIGQTDFKRLMAYSSISHMGYALIGIASGTEEGIRATLIYLAIYVAMNIGTFAFILSMRRDGSHVSDIRSLGNYSRQAPARALALLVLLFSLAGIVPMIGFFAKLYVFLAAIETGLVWLAVAGGVASVIGAYYYLRIVYFMYFGEEGPRLDGAMPRLCTGALMVSAAITVVGVINLFGITGFAETAAAAIAN